MASNLYSEIPEDLQKVADVFEDRGYTYKIYMYGKQFNVEDKAGVIQSYYPTTGTLLFHRSNARSDRAVYSIKNSNLETFMKYLDNPEDIQKLFK